MAKCGRVSSGLENLEKQEQSRNFISTGLILKINRQRRKYEGKAKLFCWLK